MSEPDDNVPMEWHQVSKGMTYRQRISAQVWRRQMTDFAKFVYLKATDLTDTLTPEEMLDAWIDMTYNKPIAPQPTPAEQTREENQIPLFHMEGEELLLSQAKAA